MEWLINASATTPLLAVVGLFWYFTHKSTKERLRDTKNSVDKTNETVVRMEGKIEDLVKTVFEMKGEVKGRAYAESEHMIQELLQKSK